MTEDFNGAPVFSLTPDEISYMTYPSVCSNEFTLDENVSLINQNATKIGSSQHDLGLFERFALEIQHQILIQCEIDSLVKFACVNRKARLLTRSMPEYVTIMEKIPQIISAIHKIDAGRWITWVTLYNKLCLPACESCGDFGGYLYLLTCKRICFLCFTEKTEFLPLRLSRATKEFGLRRPHLRQLPHIRSVPGRYSLRGKLVNERITLVDRESTREAAAGLTGSQASRQNDNSHGPNLVDYLDDLENNTLRFMAVVAMPWWNKKDNELVPGFFCLGCGDGTERPLHFRRKFNAHTFEEHIRTYGGIREGAHRAMQEQMGVYDYDYD